MLRHRVGGGHRLAATDWLENIILVQNGEEFYNQWVNHEVPFDAPEVQQAMETMESLLLAEGHVNGGRQSIASNNFGTAAFPVFDQPPGCYMYRQGNFVAQEGVLPDEIIADIDNIVGVFPVPGESPDERPVLGGGDLAGIFSADNEAAQELVRFLASSDFGTLEYGASGNWISPRTDFDVSLYPTEIWREIAEIAYSSTAFVFDGSDQMPGEVGSGSFWREMVAWISGGQEISATLENIESSWPA
ncbi:ABC transporter substrate-binding protein [Blastococcus sp. PRF04-17]|uniref:ABC transporter substrate-binding protein n=1 Tax=Blastococcus sp. PRF04-17 TaxID=2933797 RepID=UPI001FF11507|nr:ABC transporter substrate-binding protein [Blastococcus sp. PRF04-17]UOY02894.1 ABC transporter substrate-binding protein [Blastococcus sp. PRF04-17]